jgi:hypothetical protein
MSNTRYILLFVIVSHPRGLCLSSYRPFTYPVTAYNQSKYLKLRLPASPTQPGARFRICTSLKAERIKYFLSDGRWVLEWDLI